MPETILIIVILITLILSIISFSRESKIKPLGMNKNLLGIIFIIITVLLLNYIGFFSSLNLGGLTVGAEPKVPITTPGAETPPPVAPIITEPEQIPINTFTARGIQKHSNDATVGSGSLKVYREDANPRNPTEQPLISMTLSSGTVSQSSPNLKTDTNYRVVYDGGGTDYDNDLGVISFGSSDYSEETGEFIYQFIFTTIGTIEDMFNEGVDFGATNVTLTDTTIMNGQANTTDPSLELSAVVSGTPTVDNVIYNESAGDGSWYIDPTIFFSGDTKEVQNAVLCYVWDTTNPPENNEYSAITYTHQSGEDLDFVTNQLNLWTNELCNDIGTQELGFSSTLRLTFTTTEANLDTNDDWSLRIDDLGSFGGNDIIPTNRGATGDKILIDSVPN